MKKNIQIFKTFLALAVLTGCVSTLNRNPQSAVQSSFHLENIRYDTKFVGIGKVDLRAGFFNESSESSFKGCVMYLQGLGDSILNHRALFQALSESGFRVITFDYMGQGGSSSSMNNTRLHDPLFSGLEIGSQAKYIWDHYSNVKNKNGLSCADSKKLVIGWSTGGLASYKLASDGWADAVVLIAPGLYPKKFVGEGATSPKMMLTGEAVITERTLTKHKFENGLNPHIDPVKPTSPTQVPFFATNLLITSELAHYWSIPETTRGLVFLSGEDDTYVDLQPTVRLLHKKVKNNFEIVVYDKALHEIDNEVPEISNDLIARTVQFFNVVK